MKKKAIEIHASKGRISSQNTLNFHLSIESGVLKSGEMLLVSLTVLRDISPKECKLTPLFFSNRFWDVLERVVLPL